MSLLLPDKHTPAAESLLAQAERVYVQMGSASPVPQAWMSAR